MNAPLAPTAAPGQTYGQGVQQLTAQQAVPMAPQPPAGPTGQSAAPAPVAPGSLGPLTAPTSRPDEPLTAGAPVGPGANSLGLPTAPSPLMQAQVFLNQIPNLPASLAAIRDTLRVQSQ